MVCGVVDDSTVNLVVFDANGYPHPMSGIHLCQDDEQPEQYTAEWMPYQIGQAKKYEEGTAPVLDAKLAKIQEDQVELDRRLKLIESRPTSVDLRSPDDPNYDNRRDLYDEPERVIPPLQPNLPLKPGQSNVEAQRAQNDAKRDREANTLKVTGGDQIAGSTPDGPVKLPPPPKAEQAKK